MIEELCKFCGKIIRDKVSRSFCCLKCQRDFVQKAKTEEWLRTGVATTKGGSHKQHFIKKFLLEAQNHKCSICGCDDIWLGKELVFIKDHIDGNAENNNRANLRLICPNCDSQLLTFKNRNKGNGRHARRERYKAKLSY